MGQFPQRFLSEQQYFVINHSEYNAYPSIGVLTLKILTGLDDLPPRLVGGVAKDAG